MEKHWSVCESRKWRSKLRSIKNFKSILECPTINALVATFDAKSSMTRNCGNCAWPAGTGLSISRGKPTENVTVEIFDKTHGLHFCKFHICLFLSVLVKASHTAHMYGGIKTIKHNVGTTLRFAYHGCKNFTHTNKTRHVKRTQLVELLGSRFACFLLFQTPNQRNRRAKWCEVQIRTVSRKSLIGGVLHLRRGTWHSENLIKYPLIYSALYFNLRGWEPLI